MGQFTVRVQLRKVAEDDEAYETLHAEMKKRSLSRTIKGSEGALRRAPMGHVQHEVSARIDKVLEKAKEAAEVTGHKARHPRHRERASEVERPQEIVSEQGPGGFSLKCT